MKLFFFSKNFIFKEQSISFFSKPITYLVYALLKRFPPFPLVLAFHLVLGKFHMLI